MPHREPHSLPHHPSRAPVTGLAEENALLRSEIRVAHQAAEISAQLVIAQFEKTEALLSRFQTTSNQLSAVLNAAQQISIIATDLEGTITLFNHGAERMLGYRADEMVGCHSPLTIHLEEEIRQRAAGLAVDGEPPPEGFALFARLAVDGGSGIQEWTYVRKGGERIPVHLSITPIYGGTREVTGYLGVAMDISELKAAQERLRCSYQELEEANRDLQKLDQLKSELLSSVSHELRTPLTSIRGFTQLIRREFARSFAVAEGAGEPKQVTRSARILENLDIILVESERLTRLINDVLDLAKIESGRLEWHDDTFPVGMVVNQAVNAVRGQFDGKSGVALRSDLGTDPLTVTADRDRLVQVLVNLLNNAAKFTQQGEVVVAARRTGEGWVEVAVRDTGEGFPPEQAEAIFDKFQQVVHGDTLRDKPKGTGLGLSICREIVNHYGGRIWAVSEPGRGSTFTLALPPAGAGLMGEPPGAAGEGPSREQALPPLGAAGGEHPLILVVDDDPGICRYLEELFQEHGYGVVRAGNGQEALEAARRHRPDLITMDLAMPVMDGRTAIHRLRADAGLSHIPIVVVSAVPGYEQAGGDMAMGKPVDEALLLNSCRLLLRGVGTPVEGTPCLVLAGPGAGEGVPVPASISTGEVCQCPREELLARVREGFNGLVVIPAEMVPQLDGEFLRAVIALQVLIVPHARDRGSLAEEGGK